MSNELEMMREFRARLVAQHAEELRTTDAFVALLEGRPPGGGATAAMPAPDFMKGEAFPRKIFEARVAKARPEWKAKPKPVVDLKDMPKRIVVRKGRPVMIPDLRAKDPLPVASPPERRAGVGKVSKAIRDIIPTLGKTFTRAEVSAALEARWPEMKTKRDVVGVNLLGMRSRGELTRTGAGTEARYSATSAPTGVGAKAAPGGWAKTADSYEERKKALGIHVPPAREREDGE